MNESIRHVRSGSPELSRPVKVSVGNCLRSSVVCWCIVWCLWFLWLCFAEVMVILTLRMSEFLNVIPYYELYVLLIPISYISPPHNQKGESTLHYDTIFTTNSQTHKTYLVSTSCSRVEVEITMFRWLIWAS